MGMGKGKGRSRGRGRSRDGAGEGPLLHRPGLVDSGWTLPPGLFLVKQKHRPQFHSPLLIPPSWSHLYVSKFMVQVVSRFDLAVDSVPSPPPLSCLDLPKCQPPRRAGLPSSPPTHPPFSGPQHRHARTTHTRTHVPCTHTCTCMHYTYTRVRAHCTCTWTHTCTLHTHTCMLTAPLHPGRRQGRAAGGSGGVSCPGASPRPAAPPSSLGGGTLPCQPPGAPMCCLLSPAPGQGSAPPPTGLTPTHCALRG